MTTITKERLLTIKQWRETYGPGSNVVLPAEEAEELAQIALASLEAEPVAWLHSDNGLGIPAITRSKNIADSWLSKGWYVQPLYIAKPVPVVPEEKPMPNPLSMLEREITQLIGDAQEATVTGYELIAEAWRLMDGQDPKTSDWHSKASKYLNSNIVEKVDDDRIEAVKAVLRRLAGNSPVTPDGWISCSERMPDKLIPVMVMYEDGEMWSAMWNGNRWDDGTEYPDPHSVTHWREMPAAPQQEVKRV
ncbi:DUF551 domain-containing protein [Escherichia coli]|nr:DUF551 domain-containing protein [Escherichia coli]EEQ3657496.1 DUF551 domain-containing protein [Escherichia coli]EET8108966.1 DUF551 domain-containing protein [Escherichia coli]EET8884540.1 DUF551 domain-containing protein [Escherichia coli]EEZ8347332.1 DUF551 domain-containing protein [Escherichia coli]